MVAAVDPGLMRRLPRKAASISYVGRVAAYNYGGNPAVFSGAPRGLATPDRKILTAFGYSPNNATPITAVTHAGPVSAALVSGSRIPADGSGNCHAEAWLANVPLLTAGDITVATLAAQSNMSGGIWALYGAGAVHDVKTATTAAATALSVNIAVPAKGGVIAYAENWGNSRTFSWTGVDEDFDQATAQAGVTHSGAHKLYDTAQAALAVTATLNTTADQFRLTVMSFGPAS